MDRVNYSEIHKRTDDNGNYVDECDVRGCRNPRNRNGTKCPIHGEPFNLPEWLPKHPPENVIKGGDHDFMIVAEVDLKEELEKFVEYLKSKQYDFRGPMPDVVQMYLNEKRF